MSDPAFRLGEHSAQINALSADMKGVKENVKDINDKLDKVIVALAEKRGERRAAAYVAGLAGTLVSIAISLLFKFVGPR